MKKTIILLSALIFSLTLMIPSLMWADEGKHKEGSASKEYKDKKHSEDYKGGKGHMKEGSADKEEYDKKAEHKKMEEGSKGGKKIAAPAPRKEGS